MAVELEAVRLKVSVRTEFISPVQVASNLKAFFQTTIRSRESPGIGISTNALPGSKV